MNELYLEGAGRIVYCLLASFGMCALIALIFFILRND